MQGRLGFWSLRGERTLTHHKLSTRSPFMFSSCLVLDTLQCFPRFATHWRCGATGGVGGRGQAALEPVESKAIVIDSPAAEWVSRTTRWFLAPERVHLVLGGDSQVRLVQQVPELPARPCCRDEPDPGVTTSWRIGWPADHSRCTASQHGVLARQDAVTATSFARASDKHSMSPAEPATRRGALQTVVLRAESGRAPAAQRALPHRRAVAVPPASFFLQQAARGLRYTAACLGYAAHSHSVWAAPALPLFLPLAPVWFGGSGVLSRLLCFGCVVSVVLSRLLCFGCLFDCFEAAGLAAVRADRQRAPVWSATEPQRAVEHHTATARIV